MKANPAFKKLPKYLQFLVAPIVMFVYCVGYIVGLFQKKKTKND